MVFPVKILLCFLVIMALGAFVGACGSEGNETENDQNTATLVASATVQSDQKSDKWVNANFTVIDGKSRIYSFVQKPAGVAFKTSKFFAWKFDADGIYYFFDVVDDGIKYWKSYYDYWRKANYDRRNSTYSYYFYEGNDAIWRTYGKYDYERRTWTAFTHVGIDLDSTNHTALQQITESIIKGVEGIQQKIEQKNLEGILQKIKEEIEEKSELDVMNSVEDFGRLVDGTKILHRCGDTGLVLEAKNYTLAFRKDGNFTDFTVKSKGKKWNLPEECNKLINKHVLQRTKNVVAIFESSKSKKAVALKNLETGGENARSFAAPNFKIKKFQNTANSFLVQCVCGTNSKYLGCFLTVGKEIKMFFGDLKQCKTVDGTAPCFIVGDSEDSVIKKFDKLNLAEPDSSGKQPNSV